MKLNIMTGNYSELHYYVERECVHKGERYNVRDNGSVYRHSHVGKKPRRYDNVWTIGKVNFQAGYLDISSVRVHTIVAIAFHGAPPTSGHVVDHIDTNRQNNRPENLRWVTRLENILLNPITAKRIAKVYGSVEAFLEDPTKFSDKFPEPNYSWMCSVSAQEAQTSLEHMLAWAKSDKHPTSGSLGEWILGRGRKKQRVEAVAEIPDIIMAKTENAAQRDWRVPSEFPCCPLVHGDDPLTAYAERLQSNAVFCRNEVYSSLLSQFVLSGDHKSIYVITESKTSIKAWGLAKITFEDGLFVHTSLRTFFTKDGVEKAFCLVQGQPWSGPDSIDDFC